MVVPCLSDFYDPVYYVGICTFEQAVSYSRPYRFTLAEIALFLDMSVVMSLGRKACYSGLYFGEDAA